MILNYKCTKISYTSNVFSPNAIPTEPTESKRVFFACIINTEIISHKFYIKDGEQEPPLTFLLSFPRRTKQLEHIKLLLER